MNQISICIVGLTAAAFAISPALAEDLTAGKTPAQLFRSDCSTCHHSTSGLVKERRDIGSLTDFLREHYTTKPDSAAALAAYVSGFAPAGGSARTRGSADDRPHTRGDADAPRPPRGLPASARVNEPADPVSPLRNFLSPGVSSDGANETAAKPKARKRRTDAAATHNTGAPAAAAPAAEPSKPPQLEPEPGKLPEPPGDPK